MPNKSDVKSCMAEINTMIEKATDMATGVVESMARDILATNPELNEFIMGMGTYFFKDVDNEIVNTHNEFITTNGRRIIEDVEEFEELNDFIDKWDDELRLTSNPMRFTTDGEIIRDW